MDWDKYVVKRMEEHNQELYKIERRVDELIGLKSEREIRIEEGYLKVMKGMRLVALEAMSKVPNAEKPVLSDVVSDWDFENTQWLLDTSNYVSPPSSLRLIGNAALCKFSEAMKVTNGMIVSQVYFQSGVIGGFAFRREMPAGSAHRFNYGYAIYISYYASPPVIILTYYETTSSTRSYTGTRLSVPPTGSWNLLRATWWSDPGGAGLIVRFEYLSSGEWVKICEDINDPYDSRKTADIARVGVFSNYGYLYFDDTEIWKSTA